MEFFEGDSKEIRKWFGRGRRGNGEKGPGGKGPAGCSRQRENGSWVEEENSAPYNTSLLVLAFTVPYRQLPIYQRDETVDED